MSAKKRALPLPFSLDSLVRDDHPYRVLLRTVPFRDLCGPLARLYSPLGRKGYPPEALFKALCLQWMEDLSDREAERFLEENLAGKLFCGFGLRERTPDHSTFHTMRERLGPQGAAELFQRVGEALERAGLARGVFTFVDATHLISKASVWEQRDRGIQAGIERLSNETVGRVSSDPDARFGRKGGFRWHGYKIHVAVDMHEGLVVRVAATPASVEDQAAAELVLPKSGMVFADKAYSFGKARRAIAERGLHSGAVMRKDMKGKDFDKDRWLSALRMPYEGTFARFEKRARYRGLSGASFQASMQALAHNLKRLVRIGAPPLEMA